jgi:hypothetical protein
MGAPHNTDSHLTRRASCQAAIVTSSLQQIVSDFFACSDMILVSMFRACNCVCSVVVGMLFQLQLSAGVHPALQTCISRGK